MPKLVNRALQNAGKNRLFLEEKELQKFRGFAVTWALSLGASWDLDMLCLLIENVKTR